MEKGTEFVDKTVGTQEISDKIRQIVEKLPAASENYSPMLVLMKYSKNNKGNLTPQYFMAALETPVVIATEPDEGDNQIYFATKDHIYFATKDHQYTDKSGATIKGDIFIPKNSEIVDIHTFSELPKKENVVGMYVFNGFK